VIELEAIVDSRRLREAIEQAPRVMASYLRGGFIRMGRGYVKDFLTSTPVRLKKAPSSRGRHASLGRSDQWPVKTSARNTPLDELKTSIGTKSGIAKLLETGGTITPSGGRRLAIPLQKRRYRTPAEAQAKGAKLFPRNVGGRVFLFEQKGNAIVPVFLLADAVTIRPQLRFYSGWDSASAKEARVRRLGEELNRGIRRAFGEDSVKGGVG